MVIRRSLSSGDRRSTRSAIRSCTVCGTGYSPAHAAPGRHRPLATGLIRLQRSLREHRLEQLDGVQWVSSRDAVNSSGQAPSPGGRVTWPSSRITCQTCSSVSGRSSIGLRMGLGPDDPAEPRRGRIAFDLAKRHRAEPQHGRLLEPPDEIAQQPAGVVVAPLQIVDGESHRPLAATARRSCAMPSNSRQLSVESAGRDQAWPARGIAGAAPVKSAPPRPTTRARCRPGRGRRERRAVRRQ